MSAELKTIRTAVRDGLIAAATAAGARVYANRARALGSVDVEAGPLIILYTSEESADEPDEEGPRYYRRRARFELELVAVAHPDAGVPGAPDEDEAPVDEILDDLHEQVEVWATQDRTLGAHPEGDGRVAQDFVYRGMEEFLALEGEKPLGVRRLSFDALYETPSPKVPPVLEDLEETSVEFDVDGDGTPEATDLIEMETA